MTGTVRLRGSRSGLRPLSGKGCPFSEIETGRDRNIVKTVLSVPIIRDELGHVGKFHLDKNPVEIQPESDIPVS